MATLAELLSPSMIESAMKMGLSSPYASLIQSMGYNWIEGGRVPDSQADPSGWFMGASERGDGAYNDPYAHSLSNMYQRYDSETGNWSPDRSYSNLLGNMGYMPTGGNGVGSFWKTQPTLDWFNQNYGTNFQSPLQYAQWLYGGGDLINDPNHGQLFKLPEGRTTADFVNKPLSYEKSDWFDTVIPGIIGAVATAGMGGYLPGTTSIFGGASGAGALSGGIEGLASSQGFLPGSFELGSSLYGGTAASGLNAAAAEWLAASGLGTSGGGMGFFDDILGGLASDQGFLPGSFELGESLYGGTAAEGLDYAAAENWLRNLAGSGTSSLGNSLGRLLFGGDQTGGSNGLLGFLGGGLGSAINTAPILAAINYARNQDPFDTSRLQSLYSNFDPSAQAFQYDTNTGLGREELTSGLARRGISGSSFGDQSLTNYNTFRDLGRQSLLNQGIGQQAGIAGQILNADVAERQMKNDLYGRALLALSGGLAPRTSGALFA